jgi:hypothetical protein
VPGSSRGIFLSYRREDTAPYARLLKSELSERFPDGRLFMDLDSVEAGLDFGEVIAEAVDSSAALVALIGRGPRSPIRRGGGASMTRTTWCGSRCKRHWRVVCG